MAHSRDPIRDRYGFSFILARSTSVAAVVIFMKASQRLEWTGVEKVLDVDDVRKVSTIFSMYLV